MPGIILEGGTFRPIFSAGVMDALLDEDIMFPYMIGVSAGICDGFSYISKQKERNLKILMNHRNDKRYMGARNLLKERSLFGLDFVYDTIPNKLYPFDWKTFNEYKGTIKVGVTNAWTGKAESIPIRRSIEDGNEKNLIVLTRPEGYRKELSKSNKAAAKLLKRKYPHLPELLLNRHIRYNKTVRYCEQLEREGKAVILRPEYTIDSLEKDIDVLKQTYDMGYRVTKENINRIKELF